MKTRLFKGESHNSIIHVLAIFFLFFLYIDSSYTQDIIVRNIGDTIFCRITNIDSMKIMFNYKKDEKVYNTYILKTEVKDYKIAKSYDELIREMSNSELDFALNENRIFIRNGVLCTLLGPVCTFGGLIIIGFAEYNDDNWGKVSGIVSTSIGILGTIAGIISIPIGIAEKKDLKNEQKRRQGGLSISPTYNGMGLVYKF